MVCSISDPEVLSIVQDITNESARPTALVILGTSPSARARLLNCLVGRKLLPDSLPRGCKWVCVSFYLHLLRNATVQTLLGLKKFSPQKTLFIYNTEFSVTFSNDINGFSISKVLNPKEVHLKILVTDSHPIWRIDTSPLDGW